MRNLKQDKSKSSYFIRISKIPSNYVREKGDYTNLYHCNKYVTPIMEPTLESPPYTLEDNAKLAMQFPTKEEAANLIESHKYLWGLKDHRYEIAIEQTTSYEYLSTHKTEREDLIRNALKNRNN